MFINEADPKVEGYKSALNTRDEVQDMNTAILGALDKLSNEEFVAYVKQTYCKMKKKL